MIWSSSAQREVTELGHSTETSVYLITIPTTYRSSFILLPLEGSEWPALCMFIFSLLLVRLGCHIHANGICFMLI